MPRATIEKNTETNFGSLSRFPLEEKSRSRWRLKCLCDEPPYRSQHPVKFCGRKRWESRDKLSHDFTLVTWSMGLVALRVEASHGKWVLCLLWCPWILFKWICFQFVMWRYKSVILRGHVNLWVVAPRAISLPEADLGLLQHPRWSALWQ